MFKGTLYMTTDINMVQQMMTTSKVVIIGEPEPGVVQATGAVVGSVLLPPYQAMMARMDNDMQSFCNIYNDHLFKKESVNFLTVIFRALYNGTNILLYSTQDEYSLYFQDLYNHVLNNYGVLIGTPTNPFQEYTEFSWKICSLMYMYEVFSIEEFFTNYPQGIDIPDDLIMKLVYEMHPYVEDTSFEGYKKYFSNYKERIKSSNRFLSNIMHKVQH